MPYTPDALNDTQPIGSVVPASTAAAEFRAIKTKLIEHETAITDTLPDAITEIADDLAAISSPKNRQVLTGSGNFTVPASVTSLTVFARGGGVDGVTLIHGAFGVSQNWWSRGAMSCVAGEDTIKVLTVSPGDVIAYSVGDNGVYTIPSATDTHFTEATAATDTTFGSITCKCAQGKYEGGIGIVNYQNFATVAYSRDDYPPNPAATRALLSATDVKMAHAFNLLTVTQYPSPAAYLIVEW